MVKVAFYKSIRSIPKAFMISTTNTLLRQKNMKPPGSNVAKLIPNLYDKKRYVVHYETVKLYESLGLKVTKVHRGIGFL